MSMDRMSWKMSIVTKAFLLYLTSDVFKVVSVAGKLADLCASCHVNATCDDKTDGSGGKVCNCMYGFLGNGRTQCQDKDECQFGASQICGDHTVCHNTYGSFYCTCLSGYSPSNNLAMFIPNDGTHCNDIDECKVQGICGEGGWCINVQGDFNCRCQVGYKVQNGSQPFHPHRDKAFCKAIDCGQPPSVAHASQLSETGTRYGNTAKFGCLEGFLQKSGNDTDVCGEEGVWKGLSLVCEEINCGPPAVFPNTEMHWDNTTGLGSMVHYTCKYGFYQEGGSSHSTCTSAREWERITITCKEIGCGEPPALPQSVMRWNESTRIGTEVHYECDIGFYNVGGQSISVCTANGYWEGATLQCQEIDCGEPISIPHASILWDQITRMGSMAYYHCDEGYYRVNGKNHSVCGANGLWEDIAMHCEEINCGPPAVFSNTDMHWDNTTGLGSVVHYTCKYGFYQEGGSSHSTCTSAREWEPITITCKENCGLPPLLPHSEVEWQNGSVVGSMALHRCHRGYWSRRGRNVSICTDAGKWQEATLFCREIKPAISKLVVFNEKCMRWKAEIYYGEEENYTIQLVGSRDYQSAFQHERKSVFSSAADRPELCLNLFPGTNYTINITALSARFSSIISANTSIQVCTRCLWFLWRELWCLTVDLRVHHTSIARGPRDCMWQHRFQWWT